MFYKVRLLLCPDVVPGGGRGKALWGEKLSSSALFWCPSPNSPTRRFSTASKTKLGRKTGSSSQSSSRRCSRRGWLPSTGSRGALRLPVRRLHVGAGAVIRAGGAQALILPLPAGFCLRRHRRGGWGAHRVQKLPCPGQGGLGRSEWDPNPDAFPAHLPAMPGLRGRQWWAGGWGFHTHPADGRGGGTSWQQGPLSLSRVTTGSLHGPAM